jgi:hypothetical protein
MGLSITFTTGVIEKMAGIRKPKEQQKGGSSR